jgi:carotenoid cleavage dioxygenase-like enzyme
MAIEPTNVKVLAIQEVCPHSCEFPVVPQNSDTGWILTVVYDSRLDRSEVRIYQSDRVDGDPYCRLALPSVIPPCFHGTWRSSSTASR